MPNSIAQSSHKYINTSVVRVIRSVPVSIFGEYFDKKFKEEKTVGIENYWYKFFLKEFEADGSAEGLKIWKHLPGDSKKEVGGQDVIKFALDSMNRHTVINIKDGYSVWWSQLCI